MCEKRRPVTKKSYFVCTLSWRSRFHTFVRFFHALDIVSKKKRLAATICFLSRWVSANKKNGPTKFYKLAVCYLSIVCLVFKLFSLLLQCFGHICSRNDVSSFTKSIFLKSQNLIGSQTLLAKHLQYRKGFTSLAVTPYHHQLSKLYCISISCTNNFYCSCYNDVSLPYWDISSRYQTSS